MPDQEPQGQGGASELAFFGEELRREREIRGISLKEIADATKISRRFLDALERNDHRTLPAPVFTRGFVREYSRYVGLNAEDMVNRYNFAAANDDRIEKPPQVEKYPQTLPRDISPKPPRKRGIPPVYARIDRNLVAAAFIAAALAAATWWAVQNRRFDSDWISEPAAAVTAAPAPAPIPVAPPKPVVDDSKLRLEVEVIENAWVVLDADGKNVVKAEMERGERHTFEANEAFHFRNIGNAAGLKLTLNGAIVPPLGDDGEVIQNRVFDRQALEQIRSGAAETPQTQS